LAEEIIALTNRTDRMANLCGTTNLKQLGALFKKAALVVANDTGPMHIAVAMQAPTIALFGPTSPQLTGPRGKGRYTVIWKAKDCAVPCYDLSCTDNRCMKYITVEDVMVEAKKLLTDSSYYGKAKQTTY
jgi:ADP-heptose:LPS heptosyltransferase